MNGPYKNPGPPTSEPRPSGPNWTTDEQGSIILKAKIQDKDSIIPYGVIFRLVHRKMDGAPLIRVTVAPMTYDENLHTFQYAHEKALPAWFEPKEWLTFLAALRDLIPHEAP